MIRFKSCTMVALMTLGCSIVDANDSIELLTTTIPASACQPNKEGDARVKLERGAWVFADDVNGSATLFCPLPLCGLGIGLSHDLSLDKLILTVGEPENDVTVSFYRVYFRDADRSAWGPFGPLSDRVRVRLTYRNEIERVFVGDWWSSNDVWSTHVWGGHRREEVELATPHTLKRDRLYFFYMQLTQGTTIYSTLHLAALISRNCHTTCTTNSPRPLSHWVI